MGKRGQVTIFIIVGIMLLVVVSLLTFINSYSPKPTIIVPDNVADVHLFVTECLKQSAEEGINILGSQGGYITIPTQIANNREARLSLYPGFVIPYWYYPGHSKIPTEDDIKNQISDYVKTNIKECINNFTSFKNRYNIIEIGNITVSVTLATKDVTVDMNYPLSIDVLSTKTNVRIDKYSANIQVPLKNMYALAKNIMDYENDNAFMENITIDLMAMNTKIPFTDMQIKCGTLVWYLNNIKEEVKSVLNYNIPQIRLERTNYAPFQFSDRVYEAYRNVKLVDTMKDEQLNIRFTGIPPGDIPKDLYYHNNMLFNTGKSGAYTVAFKYKPEWNLKLTATPSKNGVLKSSYGKGASSALRFICINLYHFTYNVVYPVEVSVIDENAFGGKGYTFKYMFLVVIQNNEANRESFIEFKFEEPIYDDGFCNEKGNTPLEIRAIGDGYEMAETNISYICIDTICDLGKTDYDMSKHTNNLKTTLPSSCTNPVLVASKAGYLETRKQITNEDLQAGYIDIEMKKLKTLDFRVVKQMYSSEDSKLSEESQVLTADDNITLFISNKYYDQQLIYPITSDLPDEMKKITLVEEDGVNYEIDAFLTKYAYETLAGGYMGTFTFSANEIRNAKEIVFHVIDYRPTPQTDEQQGSCAIYLSEGGYQDKLKPELIE